MNKASPERVLKVAIKRGFFVVVQVNIFFIIADSVELARSKNRFLKIKIDKKLFSERSEMLSTLGRSIFIVVYISCCFLPFCSNKMTVTTF